MPLLYVQRFGQTVLSDGTQYITGSLTFSGTTIIELDPTVYTATGTYVLFDWNGASPGFTGTQGTLNTYVTVDASATGFTVANAGGIPLLDSANNRILVTLQ